MKNAYEIRGDCTAIIINSPIYGRMESLISTSKLEVAKEFPNTWCVAFKKKMGFYVRGTIKKGDRRGSIDLHRWITKCPNGMLIDHINHNIMDNTDNNLRVVTNAQNLQNRKGASSSNKVGIRGVVWVEGRNKWRVRMKVKNKYVHFGYFSDFNEAVKIAKEARSKYMPYSIDALAE